MEEGNARLARHERVQYQGCPICLQRDLVTLCEATCIHHPMYTTALPPVMTWMMVCAVACVVLLMC